MTVLYKITRIEANQPEKSIILDDSQVDIIYEALDDYQLRGYEEDLDAYNIQSKIFQLCGE